MVWLRSSPAPPASCALLILSVILSAIPITLSALSATDTLVVDSPRKSNGLTDVVQWDNYSLFIHDQRVFLHSGEFHTFRLPVPDLWLDIFQKMVAAGLNGVSIYIHNSMAKGNSVRHIVVGATNPSRGVVDFNDWRALQPIFDAAKLAGIFINAETTAGGIAHWITSEVAGDTRTNASDWTAAYTPYVSRIIDEVVPNQVSQGGPILFVQIDNEFNQTASHAAYFAQLEGQYRDGGVVVPLTYNDPGEGDNFINGTGAVDLYGFDNYPQVSNLGCSDPDAWAPVATDYHSYHMSANPSQPLYMPEFQGGIFDAWGAFGYDACAAFTGPAFQDVFYKQNWASNAKLVSYYMLYGGTSWGGFPFPVVYTSYDYGAAIRENRALSDKFDELKRQALFLRSSPEFRKTDWIGDTSTGIPGVTLNGSAAFVTLLKNPDTGTQFFVARQADSTSTANISFTLTVPSSQGTLTLPQTTGSIALNGRQSKFIVTDYTFGAQGALLYTTASIFFAGTIGARDVLFLSGDADQAHEFAIILTGAGTRSASSCIQFTNSTAAAGVTTVSIVSGDTGLLTVWESASQLVFFADPVTAATFWAPPVKSQTADTVRGLESYWQFGTNTTVLVGGPYLVRNATISEGTLALRGDLNASVPLTVVAPPSVKEVTWNGERVDVRAEGALLTGWLAQSVSVSEVKVPALTGWKFADSLPEIQAEFDDSSWTVANKTKTNIEVKPLFGDGSVLYGCDYGFCEGHILYRGHFNATGSETAANLTVYGGFAFVTSVFLNDQFLRTVSQSDPAPGQVTAELFVGRDSANALFTFPDGAVVPGQDNVLTVLVDNMGNEEYPHEKSARGIAGFELVGGAFTTWKVQGKLGGYTNFPDKVRGVMNEGGLFGEREGWHLPGFDTSSWTARDLSEGLPGPGVGFFVTTFDLAFPKNTDVLMSFQFEAENTQPYRALLFRVANLGPQTSFPVPPGILDYNGKNTIAVALWALDNTAVSPSLELVADSVLNGGVGHVATNNPVWEPRS
ncbi:hypothetical protein GSI_02573 [Ganoderma sinense ZZ0214-1]|uniref:beta-galactosidase n=1 Tax=Ganoderma sinense ZZ0214-1 TaxID=1077348 RepID=A0A2G8SLX7_9APHY|nr:hypothetical protein GSI_02573 [Ganoderma sinense ZZ0214-1]